MTYFSSKTDFTEPVSLPTSSSSISVTLGHSPDPTFPSTYKTLGVFSPFCPYTNGPYVMFGFSSEDTPSKENRDQQIQGFPFVEVKVSDVI